MDITTSLRNRGSHATGTLRVERKLAEGLGHAFGERLSFCTFDPVRGQFTPAEMPAPPSGAAKPSRGPGARDARGASLGKRIERRVRHFVKDKLGALHRARHGGDASAIFRAAQAGDVLLLGGETWSARYDFDAIARLRRERGVRLVAVCQDLIPLTHPQFFESGAFIARYSTYIAFLLRNADLLIAISQSVADDLRRVAKEWGIAPGRIEIVILGSDLDTSAAPRAPEITPPLVASEFVISVSTVQSRKNVDLLYRLWRRFAEEGRSDIPRLVVVGQRGFGSADLIAQMENDPRVRDNLLLLHRVSDAELEWLYANCAYTLYPSIAEGWGLPVSESLARGKLCLASNTTSLPEAGAGLALHLDPYDFAAWQAQIVRFSEHPGELREAEALIKASYRVRTWNECARELAELLEAMLRHPIGP